MTSVKEFRVEKEPGSDRLGRGSFVFTDDYSVFDWGKMPDTIPQKGRSLCTMGAFNFEQLEADGIPTHYRGVVTDTEAQSLADVSRPPREMAIGLTQVPDLPYVDGEYDYAAYHREAGSNYLVPLEIVFRNMVPIGSSLRSRKTPRDVGLEYAEWPPEALELAEPIIEFSTKYEEQDRYLSTDEADEIAGKASLERLDQVARRVNQLVTQQADAGGFDHHDGKIECLYINGEIQVADVVGTFDENRFAYDGQQVSKEVLRQYYKREHPDWVEAVSEAKQNAAVEGVADWRGLCDHAPPSLPPDVVATASDLYAAGTNAYTDQEWFEAPALEKVIERVRAL